MSAPQAVDRECRDGRRRGHVTAMPGRSLIVDAATALRSITRYMRENIIDDWLYAVITARSASPLTTWWFVWTAIISTLRSWWSLQHRWWWRWRRRRGWWWKTNITLFQLINNYIDNCSVNKHTIQPNFCRTAILLVLIDIMNSLTFLANRLSMISFIHQKVDIITK